MDFVIIVKNEIADLKFSEIKEAVISNMRRFMR